jgi:preprotein translocase subunit SecD
VANGGQFNVALTLSPQGAAKMAAATSGHSDRPIAVIINGEVVTAPTVRGQINEQVLITGDFTREEANRIAGGLQR